MRSATTTHGNAGDALPSARLHRLASPAPSLRPACAQPAPSSPLTRPRASLLDRCSRSGMICPAMYGAMAANLHLPYWVVTGHGGYGTPMVADLAQLRSVFDEALQTVVAMRLLSHRHGSGVGAGTGGTGGGRDVGNIERLSGSAGFAASTPVGCGDVAPLSQGRTSALDDTAGSGGAASNSWPCSWRSQTAPASERLRCRRARQELGCPHLPSPKVGRCPGRACSLAQWRAAFAVIAIQLLGKRKSHLS